MWKVMILMLVAVSTAAVSATPMGTAFTYQGKLTDSTGVPLTGSYDLTFELFDALVDGNPIGDAVELTGIPVSGGLFTVQLDFGAQAFGTGQARWLQTTAGSTVLSPRLAITATPFSLFSSAPWITSGNTISYTGSVGIGTSSPASELDVAGTARMTGFQLGTSATAGHVITADANGVGTWKAVPATPPQLARRTVNSNTAALSTDTLIGVDVSTGPVIIILPPANSVPAGKVLVISHENGNAGLNNISVTRQGADTINNSQHTIAITFGTDGGAAYRLYSDGVSKWRQW